MFTGFSVQDFSRLARCDSERASVALVRGNVTALIQEFNRRPWARGMLPELVRLGHLNPRGFFADRPFSSAVDYIHGDAAHWYIYNWGGRWRPQFNIGMYASERSAECYLRIGIGFNLTIAGHDPDREVGRGMVRDFYRQFAGVLRSDHAVASALTRWLEETPGFWEGGPASTRSEDFTAWLASSDPADQEWVFFGRRLSPNASAEVELLSDAARSLDIIERVFADLTPFWMRACSG